MIRLGPASQAPGGGASRTTKGRFSKRLRERTTLNVAPGAANISSEFVCVSRAQNMRIFGR